MEINTSLDARRKVKKMGKMSTVDLALIEAGVGESQGELEKLLDNEELALARFSEIVALEDFTSRLEEAGQLRAECESIVGFAKRLKKMAEQAQKRMEAVSKTVEKGLIAEISDKPAGDWIETKSWKFRMRDNPASVAIDNLADVPKKYRKEPKPLPSWELWEADKIYIKNTLESEKVKKIDGVHLQYTVRIEIKPR